MNTNTLASGADTRRDLAAAVGNAVDWYAARPWTARYPSGVPATLTLDPSATALTMLQAACERFDERPAFEFGDAILTYRDWARDADRLARYWIHRCGYRHGDRVLFLTRNVPEFAIAMFAAWRAGLVVVPLNTAYAAHDFLEPIQDAEPVTIVGEEYLLEKFRAAASQMKPLAEIVVGAKAAAPSHGTLWNEALRVGASLPPVITTTRAQDLALLQYTGGTTGVSKAVITTHANLIAQVEMMRAIFAERIQVGADLVLSVHPFFHSLSVAMNLMQFATNGATSLLFPNSRDYPAIVEALKARRISAIVGGPALYYGLLATPGFANLDFSTLHSSFVGGMPLRPDIQQRWEAITGTPMIEGYGLTEVAGGCIVQLGTERREGSVGFPCPSMELTIRDEHGEPVGADLPGEIWVRGPCLMPGYYHRPDETARAMTSDGWLRTGDVGRMDRDGFVYLLDRISDTIVNANDNIYPTQIEATVGGHPGVADVCAVGMPDDELGEVVRLVVVRRDPALTEAGLSAWCAEHLADFKRPRAIEFRDVLPRSALGKVLRRELRQRKI